MAEYQGDYTDGIEYSPRAALNYRIDNNQTLKFIVSRAIRTPDVLENDRDWNYYVSNFTVPFDGKTSGYFFFNAKSTKNLKSEKIESQEISYLGNFPAYGLTVDLKIYREDLDDLISEKLQFIDYHPSNDSWVNNRGAEFELRYTPNLSWLFGLTYAYQDTDTNNDYEKMLYARNSGSFYAIWSMTPAIHLSVAYFSSSSISGFPYDRLDLGASKDWNNNFSTFVRVSRLAEQSGFAVTTTNNVLNRYNSLYEGVFGVKFSY
jgi:iron complex outermembrane receptor protein